MRVSNCHYGTLKTSTDTDNSSLVAESWWLLYATEMFVSVITVLSCMHISGESPFVLSGLQSGDELVIRPVDPDPPVCQRRIGLSFTIP